MKKLLIIFLAACSAMFANNAFASGDCSTLSTISSQYDEYAKITFRNTSDYTMTIKIIKPGGGLYTTVYLSPRSREIVAFGRTATYSMKIKAVHNNNVSYHKGGNFSVTCNQYEWTEGEISFSLSIYGSGLGPTISKKEFESNY